MADLLPLLRHVGRTAVPTADAELLARFADQRDEAAFAELVRRHGPVVFRVCRRLVGANAAEDAFQATFLVLATRLAVARRAPAVGGWLVAVAGRIARQVRRAARRRAWHERAASAARSAAGVDQSSELTDQFRALDEELARLPADLRDPVVLCLLQGRTHEQAAAELGRDARTLRRRLDRARRVLRARLERRGVVPAVAAGLVAGIGSGVVAVPPALALRAVTTVFDFLTSGPAAAGPPVALAQGVAMTMLARKLASVAVAAVAGLVCLGAVLAGDGPSAPQPAPAAPLTTAPAANLVQAAPPVLVAEPVRPLDWKQDEEQLRKRMAEFSGHAEIVVIDSTCVSVPGGFCERAGLTAEESAKGGWVLTSRERRMFTTLLDAEPHKMVKGRPFLVTSEGQLTGMNSIEHVPVTELERLKKNGTPVLMDGKSVYTERVKLVETGMSLRVTPRAAVDGLLLRVEIEQCEVTGGPVQLVSRMDPRDVDHSRAVPEKNKQSLQTTVLVPNGGTAVIRCPLTSGYPGNETLWIVTPCAVRSEKAGDAPTAPRVPAVPAPTQPIPVGRP